MRLQRLFTMSSAEFMFRSWQQLYKLVGRLRQFGNESARQLESVIPVLTATPECAAISELYLSGNRSQAESLLLRNFQKLAPTRFFAGLSDNSIPETFRRDQAEIRQQVIASADAVCRNEFSILGYGLLSFGAPVDWHLDPVSGQRSALLHWSQIEPLNYAMSGDSKVVWELNRHQWMLDLGQAYRFTGNERYAQEFAQQIRDWMRNNPAGIGINWSSSLEVAIRLISWCWALMFFRDSKALTPGLFATILGWIRLQARYIERNLSYYFSPNTHLTGEAIGLYYVATLFPELQEAQRWKQLSVGILVEQLQRQVYPDGVYFEQSVRYQYYTVEIYLHYILLARRNADEIDPMLLHAVQEMLNFLLAVRGPDGTLPQIGDNDGGWLLPLLRRAPEDFSALFCVAAVLFNRSNYAWAMQRADTPADAKRQLAPEAHWLLEPVDIDAFATLPVQEPQQLLQEFPTGGYAVMRSGWAQNSHQLIFDTGALGCPVSAGHGHADLLSIWCWAFGEAFLVDAGTGAYTGGVDWRDRFRCTGAHNTLMLDGYSQAVPTGPFSWGSRPTAMLLDRDTKINSDLVDASHDAWQTLSDPVTHRRRVLFVHSSYWIVVDDLAGSTRHQLELRYQYSPLVSVAQDADGWVRACAARGSGLLLQVFAAQSVATTLHTGSADFQLGWVSLNYGQRTPASQFSCILIAGLPQRLVTILFPLASSDASPPVVQTQIENGRISSLTIQAHNSPVHIIRISDQSLYIDE